MANGLAMTPEEEAALAQVTGAPLPVVPVVPQVPLLGANPFPVAPGPMGNELNGVNPGMPWPPPEWQAPQQFDPETEAQLAQVVNQPPSEPMPWPPPEWDPGYKAETPDLGTLEGETIGGGEPVTADAPRGTPPAGDPYLDSVQATADARKQAALELAEAEKAKNAYIADEARRLNEAQAASMQGAEQDRMKAQAAARAQSDVLAKEATDIANTKMDTGRFWKSRSMGQKLALGLAGIIGGMQEVKTGRNTAVELVQRLVGQDMEAQAEDLATRRAGLGAKQGLLAQEIAMGREEADYKYKALMTGYDMAKQAIADYSLKYQNPVLDARAAQEMATIGEAQAQATMAYQQAMEQKNYARFQDERGYAIQRGQLGVARFNADTARMGQISSMASDREKAAMAARQRDVPAERLDKDTAQRARGQAIFFSDAPGVVLGKVASEEEGVKARAAVAQYENMARRTDRYKYLVALHGRTGTFSPTAKKELEQAWANVTTVWKDREGLGVLSGPDLKLGEAALPPPQSYLDFGSTMPAVDAAMQETDRTIDARLGSMGYDGPPISEMYRSRQGAVDENNPWPTDPEDATKRRRREEESRARDKRSEDEAYEDLRGTLPRNPWGP